uniref:Uncharacterized protein n=1 Tax=Anguilla anguilla TaxID=7936 RepID=A0A0E9VP39_ANGAN
MFPPSPRDCQRARAQSQSVSWLRL